MRRSIARSSCLAFSLSLALLAPGATAAAPAATEPLATPAAAVGHPLTEADAAAWLDGLVPYVLAKNDLAGATVSIVQDGRLLLARGYGYADVEKKTPVDPAVTLFRPGSVSKLFTWTAVMQLVEQGKLDLDGDVNQYLDFAIPPAFGKPITLRHLMTHTPGFEEAVKNMLVDEPGLQRSNETWLKQWTPARVFPPGEVPAYSNYGAGLAGYIVERVSGQSFDDYVDSHLLAPLAMEHSTFRQPLPESLRGDMARGYAKASEPPHEFELVNVAPAGSLSASAVDMAHFMIAHLQEGRFGDTRILRPETAAAMHGYEQRAVPALAPMALGFYHLRRNGHRVIAHGGDTQWFHSQLELYLDAGVGLFFSVDGNTPSGLRKHLSEGFAARYFPAPAAAREPTLPTALEHGELVAGHYVSSRSSFTNLLSGSRLAQLHIELEDDGDLTASDFIDLAEQPRHWREVRPFVWVDDANGSQLSAVVRDGRVAMLSIDEVAPIMVWLPASPWISAAWAAPVLNLAIVVVLLAVVLWPVGALVRRRYRAADDLSPRARTWFRRSRLCALAWVSLVAGAGIVAYLMGENLNAVGVRMDPWLRALQVAALLGVFATPAALMNALYAWREPRGWWRRLNAPLVAFACLALTWFTFALRLLSLHLDY
jgi:CubicO group peptidase (beta-lactamase class C family)